MKLSGIPGSSQTKAIVKQNSGRQKRASVAGQAGSTDFIEIGPIFPRTGLGLLEDLFDWRIEARGLGVLEDFLLEPLQVATIEELRVRAFLSALRVPEGGVDADSYQRIVNGTDNDGWHSNYRLARHYNSSYNYEDHPRELITTDIVNPKTGKYFKSTAAGAYQFLAPTWDGLAKANGLTDFSPENQDRAAIADIRGHQNALADVMRGDIDIAIRKCKEEWASLPGSPDGQPTATLDEFHRNYEKYLQLEQRGVTVIALPYGKLNLQ